MHPFVLNFVKIEAKIQAIGLKAKGGAKLSLIMDSNMVVTWDLYLWLLALAVKSTELNGHSSKFFRVFHVISSLYYSKSEGIPRDIRTFKLPPAEGESLLIPSQVW